MVMARLSAATSLMLLLGIPFALGGNVKASGNRISNGRTIYRVRCNGCHVSNGMNVVGPSLKGILKSGRLQERDVRQVISEGRNTMPSFGGKLSSQDMDDLIRYLKTL